MNNIEEEDEYLYIEDSGVKESFFSTRIESYKKSRQNLIDGNINCIPTPFPRNKEDFPGVEHAKYYIVTGNEKSAKCFGKGTLVRMFDGSTKKVEDICPNDIVMGKDFTPRVVQESHNGKALLYKVIPSDGGVPYIANGAHILHLYEDISTWDPYPSFKYKSVEMSIEEYLTIDPKFHRYFYQIRNSTGIEKHASTKFNFSIEVLQEGEFYGFSVDKDHLFLLEDGTVVHNSQSSDFIFLLHPLMYAYKNPDKLSVHVLYFSLEMSKEDKFDQLTCFWLYQHTRGRIRIDTKRLNSLNEVLDPEVIELLESDEYKDFFEFLEAHTIFYESVGNPTGIYHQCKNFAESRGTLYYKEMEWTDNTTKKTYTKKVIDKFVKHNPKEYWIAITDHYTLLTPEGGMDLRNTVGRFSSGYSVRLRNIYGFTMVGIQQQSAESQSNESFKLDRLSPHPGNLAENKSTKNDVNMMIGIYAPWRFNKAMHFDYDIKAFKDNIRFIEIILNRNGSQGATVPLYFDGAVNYFAELPPPNSGDLNQYLDMALRAQGI